MLKALLSPLLVLAAATGSLPAYAQSNDATWVTLGTRGGPLANGERSQPANALLYEGATYLVDVGDGTVEQLAKADIPLTSVHAVFLSHLHFDHTGGLPALLGLRWQTNIFSPLTIYGPPGTAETVKGIMAYMGPATRSAFGQPGVKSMPADTGITVVELSDEAELMVDDIKVQARKNTHYSFVQGSPEDQAYQSLAFRFDTPERSITYTGDTGPSKAVEELAKGTDLLVAEMMDVDRTISDVRKNAPNSNTQMLAGLEAHLRAHHLTPSDVGAMAAAADAKRLVITHFIAPAADGRDMMSYLDTISQNYTHPTVIATDLSRY